LRLACDPAEVGERDAPGRVEAHAFGFESNALLDLCADHTPEADLTTSVDDAVPRYCGASRQGVERIADLSSQAAEANHLRDLAVRGHASAWNSLHRCVD